MKTSLVNNTNINNKEIETLVEVNNQEQITSLLTRTRMTDLDIRITLHSSLNSKQSAISETGIYETYAGLLECLKDQHVTALRRITIRRDNKRIPTKNIFLTFDRSTLSE